MGLPELQLADLASLERSSPERCKGHVTNIDDALSSAWTARWLGLSEESAMPCAVHTFALVIGVAALAACGAKPT